MTRRNLPAKWVLPDVINPNTSLCVTIRVPNERFHKAAFWGALLDLASAYKWADDPDHTAKDVALVWRDIIDGIRLDRCVLEPTASHGIEIEDTMGFRVDCDCNVFVTCCDGTEVQIATVPMLGKPTQPGDGAPQPAPNGGCQSYQATIQGNGLWFLPTPVSTGDTIAITLASGATYSPADGLWHCPDGDQFFAGACVGSTLMDSANPLPAVKSGKLVAQIGSTFYDVQGSAFTVPGGVTNQPVVFQFNYDNIAASAGEVVFTVTICNNATGQFSHYFDFTLNNFGWIANQAYGGDANVYCAYVAGQGFVADCLDIGGGSHLRFALCNLPITTPTANIKTVVIHYTGVNDGMGAVSHIAFVYDADVSSDLVTFTMLNGTDQIAAGINVNNRVVDRLNLLLQAYAGADAGCGSGEVTIIGCLVTGDGSDPF